MNNQARLWQIAGAERRSSEFGISSTPTALSVFKLRSRLHISADEIEIDESFHKHCFPLQLMLRGKSSRPGMLPCDKKNSLRTFAFSMSELAFDRSGHFRVGRGRDCRLPLYWRIKDQKERPGCLEEFKEDAEDALARFNRSSNLVPLHSESCYVLGSWGRLAEAKQRFFQFAFS